MQGNIVCKRDFLPAIKNAVPLTGAAFFYLLSNIFVNILSPFSSSVAFLGEETAVL